MIGLATILMIAVGPSLSGSRPWLQGQETPETAAESAPIAFPPPRPESADGELAADGEPAVDGEESADAGQAIGVENTVDTGSAVVDDPAAASARENVAAEESAQNAEDAEQVKQLLADFDVARAAFAAAISDLRATQIRYRNGIDRSPAAVELYREQRDRARERMNQSYEVALQLIRFVPDTTAGKYLLTTIQYRTGNDIYNADTFEGAARLLDAGLDYKTLYHSAARSGVVSGNFETSRKIYDVLKDEDLEECDLAIKSQMDVIERQYEDEMEQRELDREQDLPQVLLRTTRGDIVLELFVNQAPSAVAHFIRLVEEGFYDQLDFHQVIEHLLALTGDPNGDGLGNSGRFVVDEHDRPDARHALRGSLVLAKLPIGPKTFQTNSASSQFSILFIPIPSLTDQQVVFGRVIEGMDVASSLRRVDRSKEKTKGEVIVPPDRIISATVIRRPAELPEPFYFDPLSGTTR